MQCNNWKGCGLSTTIAQAGADSDEFQESEEH